MRCKGLSAALFLLWAVPVSAAGALSELPPPGYGASSYVDSNGCLFSRSSVHGWQVWVLRLDADRQPVCDREPTRFRDEGRAAAGNGART